MSGCLPSDGPEDRILYCSPLGSVMTSFFFLLISRNSTLESCTCCNGTVAPATTVVECHTKTIIVPRSTKKESTTFMIQILILILGYDYDCVTV
mmetsp:Transcript_9867/g.11416  ORF Transcript_9867/g.11416 Transcript_9867/m.11416 type:complete len:94 (-) Transcript_9867:81-362(-)